MPTCGDASHTSESLLGCFASAPPGAGSIHVAVASLVILPPKKRVSFFDMLFGETGGPMMSVFEMNYSCKMRFGVHKPSLCLTFGHRE